MPKIKLKHKDIPSKQLKDSDTYIYYYRELHNSNGQRTGYVFLHEHEKTEILYWLNRISLDIDQKEFQGDKRVKELTEEQPKKIHKEPNPFYVGISKYVGKYNSIKTFASGVAGNSLRNPHEDFGKAQIKFIENAFNAIAWAYSEVGPMGAEIGYSHLNRNELNERPLKIKFIQA